MPWRARTGLPLPSAVCLLMAEMSEYKQKVCWTISSKTSDILRWLNTLELFENYFLLYWMTVETVSFFFILSQGGHPQSATKFHDFSLTKMLSFYGFFLFLQPINDKFSLCSSPILQFKNKKMFKKLWGKTFLINHYKRLIVLSRRSDREKNQHFQTLKMDKIPAPTQIF